jgi:DNA-binding NtrC family response regulator
MTAENAPSAHVLVVDDERHVRQMTERMLQRHGFATIGAQNGEEAVRACAAGDTEIDVVLLDLSMPGLSGPETLLALRKHRPGLRVILCSGYDVEAGTFEAEHGERPQGVLRKPFGMAQLVAAVGDVLKAGV